jgi:hypothetical protein
MRDIAKNFEWLWGPPGVYEEAYCVLFFSGTIHLVTSPRKALCVLLVWYFSAMSSQAWRLSKKENMFFPFKGQPLKALFRAVGPGKLFLVFKTERAAKRFDLLVYGILRICLLSVVGIFSSCPRNKCFLDRSIAI